MQKMRRLHAGPLSNEQLPHKPGDPNPYTPHHESIRLSCHDASTLAELGRGSSPHMGDVLQPGKISDGTFDLGMPVTHACCDRCCMRPTSGNFTDAEKVNNLPITAIFERPTVESPKRCIMRFRCSQAWLYKRRLSTEQFNPAVLRLSRPKTLNSKATFRALNFHVNPHQIYWSHIVSQRKRIGTKSCAIPT
jgi:hypothetical protein